MKEVIVDQTTSQGSIAVSLDKGLLSLLQPSCHFTNPPSPAIPFIIDVFLGSDRPIEGDTLILTCVVSGTPTPAVTWQKDGVDIITDNRTVELENVDGSNFILHISDLEEGDAGVYRCSISNPAGSDFREVRVEVAMSSKYTNYKIFFLQGCGGFISTWSINLQAIDASK